MGTMLRGRVRAAALAALVVGSAAHGASPAAAVDGLTVGATSTYTVAANGSDVRARLELDLRNVSPDEQADGGVFTYYFDAYTVPVPAGVTDLRAESGGSDLSVRLTETDDPGTSLARVSFPDLLFDQSRRVVLTFDIPGEKPRSEDPTRVGPGFATFVAYGPGDDGRNTLRVVAPSAMSFSSTIEGFAPSTDGETTTYEATGTSFSDGGLWAAVSLRDPEQVDERVVDVGDLSFVLEAFPGDDRWADFVGEKVGAGIPVLEELVGNPWPGGLQRIREDASPSLQGFDGWFDPTGDEIVVGEQLDDDLIFHELSHAWVSGERFDERWVYEGLAQTVAERAVRSTGGSPVRRPAVSRDDDLAVALNSWDGSAGSRSADVDQYAYPASYRVMTTLLGDLDDEAFAAVVGAGIRGERAYDPPGTLTPSAGRTTWSDWLDLVQTRAGVTDAPRVYARWVLTAEQRDRLEARTRERDAYAALDEADGVWLPPEGLRDAMTAWDFDRARSVREAVAGLGAQATAVQSAAEATGLDVPDAVREAYEEAALEDQYTALASALPEAAGSITAVGEARSAADADRDPVSGLGATLLGLQERADRAVSLLDTGETARARTTAQDVTTRAGWALPLGLGVVLAVLVLVVATVAGSLLVLRRPRRPVAAGGSVPVEPPTASVDVGLRR